LNACIPYTNRWNKYGSEDVKIEQEGGVAAVAEKSPRRMATKKLIIWSWFVFLMVHVF
jgi:hypothetical protein